MANSLGLVPNANQQFFDANGDPLANGTVTFYIPGTTTYASTWSDPAGANLNPNPLTLNADGYPEATGQIWGYGSYRQIVLDQLGNTIWDNETTVISVSAAMTAVLEASTTAAAAALLGLGEGVIIPCAATISGTAISLTRNTTTTNPASEALGAFLCFIAPSTVNGPFTVAVTTDSLAGATLYDTIGNSITTLNGNQFCLLGWNPSFGTSGGWVLLFASQGSAQSWEFTSTGTWTCPAGINTILCSGCGGGGAGGSTATFSSGGAGGGGAQTTQNQSVSVAPGGVYQINIGAGGQPNAGGTGSNGTLTAFVNSSFSTLVSLAGGLGGVGGSGTGDFAGGAAGGAGGFAGESGYWISDSNLANGGLAITGAGGSTLLGAGGFGRTCASSSRNGGPGQGYGAGGGGGGGSMGSGTSANMGGAGASGYFLIQLP